MPITNTDILQPGGELEPKLFPHLSDAALAARIDAYIAAGYQLASDKSIPTDQHDNAATYWTYYRSYFAVYQRLAGTPAEARIDGQGSRKYDTEQAQAFLDLANGYKEQFEGLLPADESTSPPVRTPSASFANRLVW